MKNKNWLPNSVTLTNLALGFYAIILIFQEYYVVAAFLIFIGMLLDGIDGRLARKIAGDNPLGKELDSLADLISFGVTPALLMYQLYLIEAGVIGILVAVTFLLCAAIRLARYNAIDSEELSDHFCGLPITAAGGVLIAFVLAGVDIAGGFFIPIVLLVAYLMVSTIKYPNFARITPFQIKFIMFLVSLSFLVSLNNLSQMLLLLLIGYITLGIALRLYPVPKITRLFYT